MNIQEEIHIAIEEIKSRVNAENIIHDSDLEILFLTSLIEEEASQ